MGRDLGLDAVYALLNYQPWYRVTGISSEELFAVRKPVIVGVDGGCPNAEI